MEVGTLSFAMPATASIAPELMTHRQLRRAAVASVVGTAVEWYDVNVFGVALPYYLALLFFPSRDRLAAILAGSGVQALSALCRPIGAAVFGHVGDRVGRKRALLVTLLMAGLACFAIGLLPTYAQIGVLAPMAVFGLRMLIGFALGGEWGGAVLLTLEWSADSKHRGLWASLPQLGLPIGSLLAYAVILLTIHLFGNAEWAWRVPFLVSILIVGLGAFLRFGILETPTMTALLEERRTVRRPLIEVARRQRRAFLATMLTRPAELVPQVILSTFFLAYAATRLHLPGQTAYLIVGGAALAGMASTLGFAWLSDRVGRLTVFGAGAACMAAYMVLAYFQLLGTRDVTAVLAAQVVGQVLTGAIAGPGAAMVAESFTPRLRYSGTATASGLGALLGVVTATLLPLYFLQTFHDTFAIGVYVFASCWLGVLASLFLKDRRRQRISVEYDAPGVAL
jgi:MFS family permease